MVSAAVTADRVSRLDGGRISGAVSGESGGCQPILFNLFAVPPLIMDAPPDIGDPMVSSPQAPAQAPLKRFLPWLVLLFLGTVWGLSFSLARIATLAGGTPFGITFWQSIVGGTILLAFTHARGRPLPLSTRYLRIYFVVALLGASLPNSLFYFAAPHVQAGVLSITVALIPIITYGISMMLGMERLSALRISGVVLGGVAIALLVLPESSLPSRAAIPWVLLACGSSLCYAAENVYLSRPALADIGPVRTAAGMNILAVVILLPVTVVSGQMFVPAFPFGPLEWAIVALGMITAFAYTMFIMVINIAGPVFASQTGYLVTLGGVVWGMVLFGETHSSWVWASVVTMIMGMALVSPRKTSENAEPVADTPVQG